MAHPIPFPLASGRYEVGPAMRRFGQAGHGMPAETGHFLPDDRLAETLAAKLDVLRQAAGEAHLTAGTADEEGLQATLLECFRLLAAEQPDMAAVDEDGVTLPHLGLRLTWAGSLTRSGEGRPDLRAVSRSIQEYLGTRHGLPLLGDALGLAVQEDLAIVRGPGAPGESDLLEWLHVCLPTNWAPITKIGGSFAAVHEPVVHSERLTATQGQIIRAMIHAGPFVRNVWGIHRDPALCHNPRIHQEAPWKTGAPPEEIAAQAYFRVERQTTHGFPSLNRALFTIRYWVAPLAEVAADPWQRERLTTALAAMTDEELRYKGLSPARDALVAWLQSGRSL